MPGVYVGTMWCLESSDAADDIYLITFRGNTTAPFASNVAVKGPGNFWDDFDAGEERGVDIGIAMYRPDAVYVVMLVEQDSIQDVASSEALGTWRTLTSAAWKGAMVSLALSGGSPSEAQLNAAATEVKNAFLTAAGLTMRFPYDPDDKMGGPQRLVIAPGQTPILEFKEKGGGVGRYKVRFKIK